jgi:predicted nucleic acid-binding Zn ribbon protein
MTPEGKVKDEVRDVLRMRMIWYYMPVQMGYGVGGIPDFICCWRGIFMGIECKAPGKRRTVTPLQRQCHSEIRSHGGRVVVVESGAEFAAWMDLLEDSIVPDVIDAMQNQIELAAAKNLAAVRAQSAVLEVAPTGFCLSCEAVVTDDSRWCDAVCRDRWESERKRNAKLQAQARV